MGGARPPSCVRPATRLAVAAALACVVAVADSGGGEPEAGGRDDAGKEEDRPMCAGQPLGLGPELWYFGCWGDAPSTMRAPCVCQHPSRGCLDGWARHGGSCFRVLREARDFAGAEAACSSEAEGGHLAVIDSAETNVVVAKLCTADLLDGCIIGARRLPSSKEWRWVSNETLSFESWFPEQPQPKGWSLSGDMFEVAVINWHHVGQPTKPLQGIVGLVMIVTTSIIACCFCCCACGSAAGDAGPQEPGELRPVDTSAITGLRAVACLAIATGHCFGLQTTTPLDLQGGFAVTVFLFVSGFTMAVAYAGRVGEPGFDQEFLLRRAARLYPVHLVGLLLSYPLMNPSAMPAKDRIPALVLGVPTNLALIQSWWSPPLPFGNGVAWTMSTMLFFYFAFGPLVRWLRRGGDAMRSLCCMAVVSACGIALPLLLFRLLLAVGFDGFTAYMGARSQPLFRLPLFVLGVIAGMRATTPDGASAVDDDPELASRELLDPAGPSVGWSGGRVADRLSALVLLAWCAVVLLGWAARGEWSLQLRGAAELLCIPLLPWWMQSLTAAKAGGARRFLTLPAFQTLGGLSFSVYILQIPLWDLTRFAVFGDLQHRFRPLWAPLLLVEVLVAAALCHRFVEEPCRRRLQACAASRRRAAPPQQRLELAARGGAASEDSYFTCSACGATNRFASPHLAASQELPVICGQCGSQGVFRRT